MARRRLLDWRQNDIAVRAIQVASAKRFGWAKQTERRQMTESEGATKVPLTITLTLTPIPILTLTPAPTSTPLHLLPSARPSTPPFGARLSTSLHPPLCIYLYTRRYTPLHPASTPASTPPLHSPLRPPLHPPLHP